VVAGGQSAVTEFHPLVAAGGYTLARIHPKTGRLHQIRVHANWLGFPVVGDKLYGPDPTLFLEFIEHGFTDRLQAALPLRRHALHASEIVFNTHLGTYRFEAPLAPELAEFCRDRLGLPQP